MTYQIRHFIVITFLFFSMGCSTEQFFYEVSVEKNENTSVENVFISYKMGKESYVDTLFLSKGKQSLGVRLQNPTEATIATNDNEMKPQKVFLSNNTLKINLAKDGITIAPSALQKDFLRLIENDQVRTNYYPLYGELNAKGDSIGLEKLSLVFDSLIADDKKKSLNYLKENPNSLLSLFAFSRYASFSTDFSILEDDFENLPAWAKSSVDGRSIAKKIQGAKATQLGNKAIDFSQASPTGEKLSLEDFRGQYILLDFWASWCGPCRKEHPDFVLAYEKFSPQNFTILSVSLDTDRDKWLKAIEKDNMTWPQVSNLKGFESEVPQQYGVQTIPANFLIDPNGVIINKNLRGKELMEVLEVMLGKK